MKVWAMELKDLTEKMNQFVQEMGWHQEDTPKPQTGRNLAISLSLEAAEVLELFQWTDEIPDRGVLASELADVCLYLLQLASIVDIDLEQAVLQKLETNYGRSW
jgi:NTP pyrophosphatase (non-canonical NTP hydrolase)